VEEVDEVEVFVLEGDEEVVLEEGRDGLIPVVRGRTVSVALQ
jgi:hypothetical protein